MATASGIRIFGSGDSNMIGPGGWACGLINAVCLQSKGALMWAGTDGESGQTSETIVTNMVQRVLPAKPDIVLLMVGTNDGSDLTQTWIPTGVKQIRSIGATCVLCTIYPRNTSNGNTTSVNAWIKSFMAANTDAGVVLADVNAVLDNGQGGWADPADCAPDMLHASMQGAAKAAAAALAVILPLLPAGEAVPVPTDNDPRNLIVNGNFDQGSPTTGVAANWTLEGFHTSINIAPSIGVPAPGTLNGNWQQIAMPSASYFTLASTKMTNLASLGSQAALSLRIKTVGIEANASNSLSISLMDQNGASIMVSPWENGPPNFNNDFADTTWYQEFPIPAGTTSLQLWVSANCDSASSPMTVEIGEVFLHPFISSSATAVPVTPTAPVTTTPATPTEPAAPASTLADTDTIAVSTGSGLVIVSLAELKAYLA
jgi:lysophospholipase L1-like esterase